MHASSTDKRMRGRAKAVTMLAWTAVRAVKYGGGGQSSSWAALGTSGPLYLMARGAPVVLQIQMENLKHSIGKSASKSPGGDPNNTFYASSSKLYKS